eukprot:15330620-Heterocapsa_arctica.AAC.1
MEPEGLPDGMVEAGPHPAFCGSEQQIVQQCAGVMVGAGALPNVGGGTVRAGAKEAGGTLSCDQPAPYSRSCVRLTSPKAGDGL